MNTESLPLMQLVQLPRDPSGCWLWLAKTDCNGYAVKTAGGKCLTARSWVWRLFLGPIPAGLVVSNTCGSKTCVNPHHLRLRTMAEACRAGIGATLTVDDIRELKLAVNNGVPRDVVAARYGISKQTISDVMRRKSWKTKQHHAPGGRPARNSGQTAA